MRCGPSTRRPGARRSPLWGVLASRATRYAGVLATTRRDGAIFTQGGVGHPADTPAIGYAVLRVLCENCHRRTCEIQFDNSLGPTAAMPGTAEYELPPSGTVLALDYGLKRVGVAVGDLARGIAHPLDTIAFEDNRRRVDAIAALVQEWQPVRLIMGMPGGREGPAHPLRATIERFARRVQARCGVPVEMIDEQLTSWAASRTLSRAGVRAKSQKGRIDALAACAILQTWFEDKRPGMTLPTESR